jgi:hypothetical protein
MRDVLPNLQTSKELYDWANANGLEKTQELLALYIDLGQPDDFMCEYTTRAMCYWASRGLEGKGYAEDGIVWNAKTQYGIGLYNYMWGNRKDA